MCWGRSTGTSQFRRCSAGYGGTRWNVVTLATLDDPRLELDDVDDVDDEAFDDEDALDEDASLDAADALAADDDPNAISPGFPVTVQPDGNVRFSGASAHKPIDEGWVAMDCTDYPFDSTYVLSPDLSTLVCAECTNCVSQRPCG